VLLQLDGGTTFTEPTAIIAGQVEGRSDVSGKLLQHILLAVPVPGLLLCYSPLSAAECILLTHARFGLKRVSRSSHTSNECPAALTPAQQELKRTA
jgi:hypothetical protein